MRPLSLTFRDSPRRVRPRVLRIQSDARLDGFLIRNVPRNVQRYGFERNMARFPWRVQFGFRFQEERGCGVAAEYHVFVEGFNG